MILSGEHNDFGPEKLKGLMKILPEQDEVVQAIYVHFLLFFYIYMEYMAMIGSYNIEAMIMKVYEYTQL